jgi:hypothetical protein
MSLYKSFNFNSTSISSCTLVNNPTPNYSSINGSNIKSIYFQSSKSQYAQIDSYMSPSNGMSFSFWFKCSSNNTWARIFDFGNGAGSNNIIVFLNNNNLGLSVYRDDKNAPTQYYNIINNCNDNIWRHVIWTLNTNGDWNIYLNFSYIKTISGAFYPKQVLRKYNYIAKSLWGNDPFYTGEIADFRIYDGVIDNIEISNIYFLTIQNAIKNYNPTWSFKPSDTWLVPKVNNKIGIWSDLGIIDNTYMTITFYIHIIKKSGDWRNIFHLSNTGNNCCNEGDRIPAIWIIPNSTGLHIRFSTTNVGNNGIDTKELILNKTTLVSIIFAFGKIIVYFDNEKVADTLITGQHMINANPNALVYISDPWYGENGGFGLQYFGITNGNNIFNYDNGNYIKNNIWTFPKSNGIYTELKETYFTRWKNLNIKSNSNMTISFYINISSKIDSWRNIFHISNTGANCCIEEDRIPACWITPNATSLFICSNSNNNFYTSDLNLNTNIKIDLIWYSKKLYVFIDNKLDKTVDINMVEAVSDATLFIADLWHGFGGFKIKDLIFMEGNNVFNAPSFINDYKFMGCYKDDASSRAISTFTKKVNNLNECQTIAFNNQHSLFGVQNGGDCWTGTNSKSAYKYGLLTNDKCIQNGVLLGGNLSNIVYEIDCDYNLNNAELQCYSSRYPDLKKIEDLQTDWKKNGCVNNRTYNCNNLPQQQSGPYNFIGCFKNNNKIKPKSYGLKNSVDECQLAVNEDKKEYFALTNNLNCFGFDDNIGFEPIYNYNAISGSDKCDPLGGINTFQIYQRDPPPAKNLIEKDANLSINDFAYLESFSNILIDDDIKNINHYNFFKYIMTIIVLLVGIFLFYYIIIKKTYKKFK